MRQEEEGSRPAVERQQETQKVQRIANAQRHGRARPKSGTGAQPDGFPPRELPPGGILRQNLPRSGRQNLCERLHSVGWYRA